MSSLRHIRLLAPSVVPLLQPDCQLRTFVNQLDANPLAVAKGGFAHKADGANVRLLHDHTVANEVSGLELEAALQRENAVFLGALEILLSPDGAVVFSDRLVELHAHPHATAKINVAKVSARFWKKRQGEERGGWEVRQARERILLSFSLNIKNDAQQQTCE